MTWFQAAVLGIVQGLTEFLPISSTAHLRIVPHFLGWGDPGAAFSAVIQLGTLAAVLIYFWQDIWKLTQAAFSSILQKNLMASEDSRLAWAIAAGNLPIIILGLTFKDVIETEARDLHIIGVALIVLGCALYAVDRFSKKTKTLQQLSFLQIQWIGVCQALALIPGCSRSGSTIMGGLLMGLNRESAARFSFLVGLPAIAGSGLFEMLELANHLDTIPPSSIGVGLLTAFVSGYASIGLLLEFLKRYSTLAFALYRSLLGIGILWWGLS